MAILCIQSASQQTGTIKPAACAWVTLPVNKLPSNKRARQTTPTTAPARLALRSNVLSGLAEKFAEAGLLVSSNAKPTAWPDLILSGFVWPDPVCGLSGSGLSSHGLSGSWPVRMSWPVPVLSGSVLGLSDT